MDKQKIEEMANDMGVSCGECYTCKYEGEVKCINFLCAEELYKAGYRKIPENAVVLTDDEVYEELDTCKVAMIVHDDDGEKYVSLDDYNEYTERLGKIASQRKARIEYLEKLLDDRCDRCIERERKETAEKFAERLSEEDCSIPIKDDFIIITRKTIDEICRELTDGIYSIPYKM